MESTCYHPALLTYSSSIPGISIHIPVDNWNTDNQLSNPFVVMIMVLEYSGEKDYILVAFVE